MNTPIRNDRDLRAALDQALLALLLELWEEGDECFYPAPCVARIVLESRAEGNA